MTSNGHSNLTVKAIKPKLRNVRNLRDAIDWWNKIVDVRVKAIVFTAIVQLFIFGGFQYQVNALTNERLDANCDVRIQSRKDLRDVMTYMVDLSDLFPGDETAEQYTQNRVVFINKKYPEITREDCV